MYIKMIKTQETDQYVVYKFETDVDIGSNHSIWEIKYGYCIFDKQSEDFKLDQHLTDSYFFNANSREILKIKVQLMKRKREHLNYEDLIEIATG